MFQETKEARSTVDHLQKIYLRAGAMLPTITSSKGSGKSGLIRSDPYTNTGNGKSNGNVGNVIGISASGGTVHV